MPEVTSTLPSPRGRREGPRPAAGVALGRRRGRVASEPPGQPTVVCGYRVGRLLGRGGMSAVFEVSHPTMRERLAMKIVTDHRLQNDLAFEAIYGHAKRMAGFASPHVVRTLDAGRLKTGEPFIVMEHLHGEELMGLLASRGALPVLEAVRMAMQLCDGLAAAHAIGVVHGDIKPANLILVRDAGGARCLKIVDFAPAVPRAAKPDDPLVTCSPGYASPEQLGARPDVDARADVWAVGAVLYELVTGQRAFDADSLPAMLRVIREAPKTMRSPHGAVPALLDRIVRRCLAHAREGRYDSALQVRAALAKVASELERAAAEAWRARTTVRRGLRAPQRAWSRRLARQLFLAALGPASAVLSMTIVRLLLASGVLADHVSPFASLVP